MRRPPPDRTQQAGFTLVEMIVSIALIGLLSMAAIPLLKLPLEGWMDATRRSTLSTEIDVIHAKLRSDMAQAMPGSVRVRTAGARVLLEYMEVRASGRYRTQAPTSGGSLCPSSCSGNFGANDVLEPMCAETCFVNLSPWDNGVPPAVTANDWVVVNPYTNSNNSPYALALRTRAVSAAANGRVDMAAHSFPADGALTRFYIVSGPVTYECDPATRRLTRYAGYALAVNQPVAFAGGTGAILSSRVQSCVNALSYTPTGLYTRGSSPTIYWGGIVNILLRLGPAITEPASVESAVMQASFTVSEIP